ncbi:uncharacterized protein LOC107043271 [Diachasma alloeum]|uniref:uncharacterized protein LOC107043271 n=1 Tax=Diachasma alloeum TaxID=454923 RepID=UPI00073811FE|nr:uncharacterized protein LOC107043271 [Diachasma alloeum]XP_015120181.1 uncharacterized protein LOC107043271 [Diachasma alloeum]
MPGIHVRTLSNRGWDRREREPALTVPGSYWLCCKQNIYKFTFKYNKTTRSPQDFSHARELMKVVRKIIKLQPRQGQQFCTRHLLVTYNQSSWTRQDKMFAMLKFRDCPEAIAYPHAFILTIKTTSPDSLPLKSSPLPPRPSPADDSSTDSSTRLTPLPPTPPKKLKSASFFGDLALPLVEKYLHEQKDPPPPDDDSEEPLNDIQETVDMPYQYLIEREIEKTKAKVAKMSPTTRKSDPQPQNNEVTTSSRGRPPPGSSPIDTSTAKSADITDLVMEGLMFTIRQDKDSVTVVEQKTKLEPDEVLENSERVEGRTGECLVNSSLLKLENLVGKIEIAGGQEREKEKEQERLPFLFGPGEDIPGDDPGPVTSTCPQEDILPHSRMRKQRERVVEGDRDLKGSRITSSSSSSCSSGSERPEDVNGDERIEEEDIIPEVLQGDNHSPLGLMGFCSRDKVTSPLMDDEHFERSPEGTFRVGPKVVSNESVKIDLSLWKSAKARRSLVYDDEELKGGGKAMEGEAPSEGTEGRRTLAARRRILPEENQEDERINLLKFVNDMTMGVRVVVQRLDVGSLSRFGGKRAYSRECV